MVQTTIRFDNDILTKLQQFQLRRSLFNFSILRCFCSGGFCFLENKDERNKKHQNKSTVNIVEILYWIWFIDLLPLLSRVTTEQNRSIVSFSTHTQREREVMIEIKPRKDQDNRLSSFKCKMGKTRCESCR